MSKSRTEAFSDGVFAIAMTLLVLDLRVPADANGHLAEAMRHEWPSYVGYLVSFSLIGIIWVNHHALFQEMVRIDRPFLFLNLLLLLCVVVIPFPTSLVAKYVRSSEDAGVAVATYSAVMLSMALSFTVLWLWSVRAKLLVFPPTPTEFRVTFGRACIGVLVYSAAIGFSFVNARLTLGFHAAVAFFYVLDQCVTRPVTHELSAAEAGQVGDAP